MLRCRNADRYRAIFPPRCHGPCDACRRKWAMAQLHRIEAALGRKPRTQPRPTPTPMHDGHLVAAMFNDSFGVIQ